MLNGAFKDRGGQLRAAASILFALIVILVTFRRPAPLIANFDLPVVPTVTSHTSTQPTNPLQAKQVPQIKGENTPVVTTHNLFVYTYPGSYSVPEAQTLGSSLEETLTYVEERTGMHLERGVNLVFERRANGCGMDAVAFTEARTLILYACAGTSTKRARNILAHELVHQLAHDHYGASHLQADLLLTEGLATWGAGRYWLGSEASFHDFVAVNYADRLLPLATDPRGGATIDQLNQIYYQWASYIEWLRATYGPTALDRLYGDGLGRQPGSAPYLATLGISFAESEAQWQAWIKEPADVK